MVQAGDSLAAIGAIKGVFDIFFYEASKLLHSQNDPPSEMLASIFNETLPGFREFVRAEQEPLRAVEIELAQHKVLIFFRQELALIVICEGRTDLMLLHLAVDVFFRDFSQSKKRQRRIKWFGRS
jgi:hypothetical protein